MDGRRGDRRERPAGKRSGLDLFDEHNGPPFSPEFVTRYRDAQTARNNAITDWAETELTRVQAAGFSDRPFTVMRTWADPRMVDPTIEPTRRQPNLCYAGVPVQANRSARGIAAACTLRNWLGMWSLRTAQTRAAAPGPDHLPGPGDQRRAGHRGLPVGCPADLRGARRLPTRPCAPSTPTTTSPPGARSEQADTIAKWIANGGAESSCAHSYPPRRLLESCARI